MTNIPERIYNIKGFSLSRLPKPVTDFIEFIYPEEVIEGVCLMPTNPCLLYINFESGNETFITTQKPINLLGN